MSGLLCVHKSPSNETKMYEFYLGKGSLLLKPRACFLLTIPRAISTRGSTRALREKINTKMWRFWHFWRFSLEKCSFANSFVQL